MLKQSSIYHSTELFSFTLLCEAFLYEYNIYQFYLTVINADLEDHHKRWLIIGIGIHSVLSPTLRKYIEPVVSNLYNSLQQTHGIQTQTYPKQLRICPTSGRELNYEAINNNSLIPRVRRKPDVNKYDYKVTNHVEFSKLFLNTFMAQYTALDDTCDLSALLGIIINIDKFPQTVQNVASKVCHSK